MAVMNNPEPKKCVVCGTEFTPKQKNYICCSSECSKERNRRYNKQKYQTYYKDNKNHNRQRYLKMKMKHPVIIPCRVCGRNVPGTWTGSRIGRKRYHDQCVLDEAKKAYLEVGSWDCHKDNRIKRAMNYGFCKADIFI